MEVYMQDNEIIELYMQRDERAVDETAKKYGAYCQKIAYNILYDVFDTEECVNDTYMRTWNAIPPTIPKIFSAFLAKITRNLALDRYNSSKAKKRGSLPDSLDELTEVVGGNSLSDQMELSEIGASISVFLQGEKPIARRIFIKRYFFEDTVEAIAKEHGLSISNVKVTLHRIRLRLAKHLEKEGYLL